MIFDTPINKISENLTHSYLTQTTETHFILKDNQNRYNHTISSKLKDVKMIN